MMSGVELVAIIVVGGVVVNGALDRVKRLAADRRDERRRLANGPEPVCGCGHHLAYHDLHDGRCYAEVKTEGPDSAPGRAVAAADADSSSDSGPGSDGGKAGAEQFWRRCACRRYAGPEPLATLYAPPIARAGYTQSGLGRPEALDALEPKDSAG